MQNLRFTQRLLHYFEFLMRDYGFVYSDEADLNASFVEGGRFESRYCTLVVRLGRSAPFNGKHRNALVVSLVDTASGHGVYLQELAQVLGLDLEPCPVVGEIRTRHALDLALAYYSDLVRSHCDAFLRGEALASELVRPIQQTA